MIRHHKNQVRVVKRIFLIVCEGKCSEPNYIKGLRQEKRASNIHIEVVSGKSDPMTLVEEAIERMHVGYDEVFCVFDRDDHKTFEKAIERIHKHNKVSKGLPKMTAIVSNPCFEIWVLMHFECPTSPIEASGKKPVSDVLIKRIKGLGFEYAKNDGLLYSKLKPYLPTAFKHASKLEKTHKGDCHQNPYTGMHLLVKKLLEG